MKITNKDTVKKHKRIFFLISIFIALGALVFFLFDYTIYGIACCGIFSFWYLFFHVADYQFIEYNDEEGKVLLRYYKVISLGTKKYHSIEFPRKILQNAHFENSVFGKLSDLTIFIKTKRGIAEYPSVSLAAVPFEDRLKIRESLLDILKK